MQSVCVVAIIDRLIIFFSDLNSIELFYVIWLLNFARFYVGGS